MKMPHSESHDQALLQQRIQHRPAAGWLTVETLLRNFAMISYAIDCERLLPLIPKQLELQTFELDGGRRALLSVVAFLDAGFHFKRLFPGLRMDFGQTNYRVYVRDRASGEPAVWFLGTTLGSPLYLIPRLLWRLPWHGARYHFDCVFAQGRFSRYQLDTNSAWGQARIHVQDTAEPMALLPGFESLAQQRLILTHPVTGFFTRPDGSLGTYSIWHPAATLSQARPLELYFKALESTALLGREQMQAPHSLLLQDEILYQIQLPPH
ncbi:MAG: hypothetical protein CVV27_09365 [Candidatus Melainabacteria bacterium HGW-Melainabacteria-1]|nr:MAG: hypothetical protein CVV27_09365 [Candidatus Melainabacteria bacterium HGW-Melainabacteria-1]